MKKISALCVLILTNTLLYSQSISGYYSGINKQEINYEYPVEILIEQSNSLITGAINYSCSPLCYGELQYWKKKNNQYFFKEKLIQGSTCVKDGIVVLEFINENTALFYWYYSDGKLGTATVLDKSSFSQKKR